jgi:hypothetical protein
MRRSRRTAIPIIFLAYSAVALQQAHPISLSFELNQLLAVAIGAEVPIREPVVLRGSMGVSPGGFSVLTGSGTLAWQLARPRAPVRVDLEAGIPIAYASLWEPMWGRNEATVPPPFAGFLCGGGICWGYVGNRNALFLVTGIGAWWEWQRDDLWKGPEAIPVLTIRYRRVLEQAE